MRFVPDPARVGRYVCVALFAPLALSTARAQQPATTLGVLDLILYTYVRDGYVYYRALKSETDAGWTRMSAPSGTPMWEQRPKEEQNRLLAERLQHASAADGDRPLSGPPPLDSLPAGEHPPDAWCVRACGRTAWPGRMLTLDKIEQTILSTYDDPRLYFAIGRGSAGGGRLRSEAYSGALLEKQLAEVASECLTRAVCIQIDSTTNPVNGSSIFLWREKDFVARLCRQGRPHVRGSHPDRAAPSSASSNRSSFRRNGISWRRTTSAWYTSLSTGLSTTSRGGEIAESEDLRVCGSTADWKKSRL